MSRDGAFMRRALELARLGWGQTAPNPMVGAVVVRDGEIVGEGYHARFGGDHAEVAALSAAGERARGATTFVTLEPCAHTGKTPPCTDALIAAGVARVVCATRDPNPEAAGGLARLAERGITVLDGVEEEAARELNAPFFHALHSERPWITLKLALSLDGAIADAHGNSRWITGEASRREVHHLRAGHDAIAVGVGTAIADDPSLTVRDAPAPRVPPRRIVFDRHARLSLTSALASTARSTPTIVIVASVSPSRASELEKAGIMVLRAVSLAEALRELRRIQVRSIFVEGGARLAGALLDTTLVDRLVIFQAPVILGAGAIGAFARTSGSSLATASRFRIVEQRTIGGDAMTVYAPPTA
ncbi:MAG: bifunctional diaminohydroxyphosphoribosylaminopyrimidine deaminase/5-amino-6-(5-phosphoribosylamino)uracil reductase RibD [Gemmatimonadaceae bacterium]|nr:bifunctional diaminohydroxyphosphoribosylaminopyrimidine deaminase/5-amino-6-(5-phosphoribosylamino)uracil reductase RibD [Gemmatimonadaceae bacterium]